MVSLGAHGSLTLELGMDLMDGPGPDLLVFENPFGVWREPGRVEVSLDGVAWTPFPCQAEPPHAGCAGLQSVISHPDNHLDPTDPLAAGGDAFDLAEIGVARARFVRVVDVAAMNLGGQNTGFDLDALRPAAAEAGITPDLVATPLDEIPADSTCITFQRARFERGRAGARAGG